MKANRDLARYRIAYAKTGNLKYTGHLDMHRMWERSLRRARLPLAYSQGFHPQPRIQQACALPLGFTSQGELVDFWFEHPLPALDILQSLYPAVPPGLMIQSITQIELHRLPLQIQVIAAEYQVVFLETVDMVVIKAGIDSLLAADSLIRERRGKTYDMRPLIVSLEIIEKPPGLAIRLTAREGATGRPEEVLCGLDIPANHTHIERIRLILAE